MTVRPEVTAFRAPTDAELLEAFVAGCNAENELNEAELSPENVRKGVAAAMRGALRGAALEAVPSEDQADAQAWREVAHRKIAAISAALDALGEPQPGYPAPVANAVAILRGESVPPPEIDEAALDAAERAYWGDDGVSRSNLAAAIRAYQAVAQRAPSDAAVEVLLATLQPFIIDRPPIGLPTELAYDALARAYTIDFGGRGASPTGVSGAAESQAK